jgi:acyl-CoA thioesterase-2
VSISLEAVTDLPTLLALERVKPDAFLGSGPNLGWGRIYGGQVVAQALRAAALTVDAPHAPHSLHAYFVRAGDERKPVLYEVERVRDGRSFSTRQVVAYQAGGAILNLIASFHAAEEAEDVQSTQPPQVPDPDEVAVEPTDLFFEHRVVKYERTPDSHVTTWLRVPSILGDDPVLHACALAYLSDENPLGAAVLPHSMGGRWDDVMAASLDHAVWFHRPARADEWLLFDLRGHGVANARGLAFARVFDARGIHVASIAQEGLIRPRREVSATPDR